MNFQSSKYIISKSIDITVVDGEPPVEVNFYLTTNWNYTTESSKAKEFDTEQEADILIQKLKLEGFKSFAVPQIMRGEK
jgi:hypothetical protein